MVQANSIQKKAWPFVIWPPLVFNLGSVVVIGGIYAVLYIMNPSAVPGSIQLSYADTQIALSAFIFVFEWIFAGVLLRSYRREQLSIRGLFSPPGKPGTFRWLPAIALFLSVNAIFLIYIGYLQARMPDLTYRGMPWTQVVLFLLLTPLTAAFTEELIWRGHILTAFEQQGKSPLFALLFSALSFSLIHGIFFPDKLLVTFLMGIIMGLYYQREKALLPLMHTHWIMDLWSFGVFFFR